MNNFKDLHSFFNLQMFADGGGAEGGAEGGEGDGSVNTGVASPNTNDFDVSQAVTFLDDNGMPVDSSRVSEQKQEQGENLEGNHPVDLGKEFHDLIKKGGKYAEEYNKLFHEQLDKRLSKSKAMKEQLDQQSAIMDLLYDKYGISDKNVQALTEKMNNDDDLMSELAAEQGMSVESYRKFMQTQRKLNALEQQQAQAEAERNNAAKNEANRQKVMKWNDEGQQLKEMYPNFNLLDEMNPENPNSRLFISLLDNGISVKSAYESVHHDEFMQGALQYAVETTRQKTINNIRSNQTRPQESAGSRQSNSRPVALDVRNMSDDQLDEIDRLSRLQNITFRRG